MNRRWVAIQRNPRSGAGPKRELLVDLVSRLRDHGFSVRCFSDREQLQRRLADPIARDNLVCIVAAGGDGTVADVVNRYPDATVTVLPLGTENLLAKYLGIPRCGSALADIIAEGHTRHFDLGSLNDRKFVLMAGIGFDAEVIKRLHESRRGHITHLSYVSPILKSLFQYQYPPFEVYVDDATTPIVARQAFIVNLPAYARGLPIARQAASDTGRFEVRTFRRGSPYSIIRYMWSIIRGTHESRDDVQALQARTVRIESSTPIPIQLDGDAAGTTPATLQIHPGVLRLIVPQQFRESASPTFASPSCETQTPNDSI